MSRALAGHYDHVNHYTSGAAASRLVTAGPFAVFLAATYFLELDVLREGINFGNIFVLLGSWYAIVMALMRKYSFGKYFMPMHATDAIFIAYLAFLTWTVTWSPLPRDVIIQVIFVGSAWLAAASLADTPAIKVASFIAKSAVLLGILSFAMIFVRPDAAFQAYSATDRPELKGVFFHQQRLGLFMAMAIGLVGISYLNGEMKRVLSGWLSYSRTIAVAVIVVALIAAFARSYTVFLVVSLAIAFAVNQRGWKKGVILSGAFMAFVCMFLFYDQIAATLGETDADLTLTGRTMIWERSLEVAALRPWTGQGFASFGASKFDYLWGAYRPPHAHNTFIQAYFDSGIVGLVLLVMFILAQLRVGVLVSQVMRRYSYSLFLGSLTLFAGLTGVFYGGKLTALFCTTMLVTAIEAEQVRRLRRSRRQARRDLPNARSSAAGLAAPQSASAPSMPGGRA